LLLLFPLLLLLQDVLSLLHESASALALHDANGDRQLDCSEFAAFMRRFMHAAGYALHEVLDELLLLAATKVGVTVGVGAAPHMHQTAPKLVRSNLCCPSCALQQAL
jgi:hypothetical protein